MSLQRRCSLSPNMKGFPHTPLPHMAWIRTIFGVFGNPLGVPYLRISIAFLSHTTAMAWGETNLWLKYNWTRVGRCISKIFSSWIVSRIGNHCHCHQKHGILTEPAATAVTNMPKIILSKNRITVQTLEEEKRQWNPRLYPTTHDPRERIAIIVMSCDYHDIQSYIMICGDICFYVAT